MEQDPKNRGNPKFLHGQSPLSRVSFSSRFQSRDSGAGFPCGFNEAGPLARDSLGPFQQLGDVPAAPLAIVVGGLVAHHDDAFLGLDGWEAPACHW